MLAASCLADGGNLFLAMGERSRLGFVAGGKVRFGFCAIGIGYCWRSTRFYLFRNQQISSGRDIDYLLLVHGMIQHFDAVAGGIGNPLLRGRSTSQRMRDFFTGIFFRNLVPQLGVGVKQDKSAKRRKDNTFICKNQIAREIALYP